MAADQVARMLLAIAAEGEQLLFFALLDEDATTGRSRGTGNGAAAAAVDDDAEGDTGGCRESEVHGGDAAIAPVLMYVPNLEDGKAGKFVEICRGVPPARRASAASSDDAGTTSATGGDADDENGDTGDTDESGGTGDAAAQQAPPPPPLVHAYEISIVERAAQRRLVYTSARSHAFAMLAPRNDATTLHSTPRAARRATGARVPAGDVFGLAVVKKREQYALRPLLDAGGSELICAASLAVSRTRADARMRLENGMRSDASDADADGAAAEAAATVDTTAQGGFSVSERADPRWAQWPREHLINSGSLSGLLPDALLERCVVSAIERTHANCTHTQTSDERHTNRHTEAACARRNTLYSPSPL